MDLEDQIRHALLTRGVAPVADPVPGVHAGMARRRRRQQVSALGTALAVVALVGAVTTLGREPARSTSPQVAATPSVTEAPVAVTGFTATDVSFVGDRGWALGTGVCGEARCTSQLVTDDGGASWTVRPARGLPSRCSDDLCVTHVRFADDRVGYAFGPSLFVTLNAGESWTRLSSPEVQALEITSSSVVRVVSTQPSCQPGCTYLVQTAPVGSLVWTTRYTSNGRGVGASLARWGDRLTLADYGNPAGGAMDARTRLALSSDGGETWTAQSDPCSPGFVEGGPEGDTRVLARGPEGSAAVVCTSRQAVDPGVTIRFSSDAGRTYGAERFPSSYVVTGLAVTGPDEAVVASDASLLSRTTDGGRTWVTVARTGVASDPKTVLVSSDSLVFTSSERGSWVPADGRSVWRTTDGGSTWEQTAFP